MTFFACHEFSKDESAIVLIHFVLGYPTRSLRHWIKPAGFLLLSNAFDEISCSKTTAA